MKKEYKTVKAHGTGEYIEKKSRFIANIIRINNEKEAIDYINQIKSKYYDARHNCYAYSVNVDTLIQRYSDDGEPSGTAGVPILEVIKKSSLENVCIVVTRYFGGTLLGAAGLVRSYGKASSSAVENAGVVFIKPCNIFKIDCDYNLHGKLVYFLNNESISIFDTQFTDSVSLSICIEKQQTDNVIKKITEITNGKAPLTKVEERMIEFDEENNIIS